MNVNELKKLIRETVREEVQSSIPQILNEYFSKNNIDKENVRNETDDLSEYKKFIKSVEEQPKQEISSPAKTNKVYVKNNPLLNQILNETVCKIPKDGPLAMQIGGNEEAMQSKSIPLSVLPEKNYADILKKSMKSTGRGASLLNFSTSGE